jgi:hypothetical protein
MVAKITVPQSLSRALNYNEQKVKEGVATCIYAHNFLKDETTLNFFEKKNRFENLIVLNKRASTNALHISLNFAEHENLSLEKLRKIASVYMQKNGFDNQSYLVYQHTDSAHPHLPIISTNIQKDGRRISLHNLGKNQSNQARKEIEIAYHLVKAEDRSKRHIQSISPINLQKVIYGKSPTKRAITNVLGAVLAKYRFASFAELNAVLRLFNVIADKGDPNSRTFRHRGLVYRIIDEKGHKVGVPIKASSINSQPTLMYLEEKFKENQILKEPFRSQTKASIDWVLLKQPADLLSFQVLLQKENISLIIRQNEQGIIYGLTYVDNNTYCVFNGSDIGKQYSAKMILETCRCEESAKQKKLLPNTNEKTAIAPTKTRHEQQEEKLKAQLETLLSPVDQYATVPYQFKKRKKKKKNLIYKSIESCKQERMNRGSEKFWTSRD